MHSRLCPAALSQHKPAQPGVVIKSVQSMLGKPDSCEAGCRKGHAQPAVPAGAEPV